MATLPDPNPETSAAIHADSEDEVALPDRHGFQSWPYVALVLTFFVIPPVVAWTVTPTTASYTAIGLATVGAFLLGALDGRVFMRTSSFPFFAAVSFWLSGFLYYDSGAWLYALASWILAWCGSWLTGHKKRNRWDTEAEQGISARFETSQSTARAEELGF